jgi:hypothetical protein
MDCAVIETEVKVRIASMGRIIVPLSRRHRATVIAFDYGKNEIALLGLSETNAVRVSGVTKHWS